MKYLINKIKYNVPKTKKPSKADNTTSPTNKTDVPPSSDMPSLPDDADTLPPTSDWEAPEVDSSADDAKSKDTSTGSPEPERRQDEEEDVKHVEL
jgi:hypothetical protein